MKHTYSLKIASPCSHCQKMPVKHYIFALLAVLMATFSYEVKASHLPIIKIETLTAENSEKPVIPMPPAKNSISGRLFDKATGKPLQFAKVELIYKRRLFYYASHKEAVIWRAENRNAPLDTIIKMKEEMSKLLTNYNRLLTSSFVARTDENGYFSLILPDDMPSFTMKLAITLADIRIKDATGKADKCMINSIENIVIDYNGGNFYAEKFIEITRKDGCREALQELLEGKLFDE